MGVAHVLPRTLSSLEEATFADTTADFDAAGQEFYGFECDLSGVAQAKIENQNYNDNPWKYHQTIRALKSASTVTWAEYLTASGTHAAEGADAAATQLSMHMRAAWGGRSLNRSAGTVSSSTNTVDVDAAEGANYAEGDLIYISDADGSGQWYIVQSISTDTLTLDRDLHFSAGASDTVKATIQCYPDWIPLTDHSDAAHTTMALAVKGVDSEDYWELFGIKPSIEMDEITQGTAPVLRFTGNIVDFRHETLTADALAGAPEGQAPLAIGTADSCKFFLGLKSGPLTAVDASSIQPRFGITHVADGGPNGREGVHGWVAQGFDAAGLDVTARFDDDFATDFRADGIYHALIQIGDGAEDSVAIYFPYLEFSAEPVRAGSDNIYSQLSFRAMQNKATTALTGADLRRWIAPFHVGVVA